MIQCLVQSPINKSQLHCYNCTVVKCENQDHNLQMPNLQSIYSLNKYLLSIYNVQGIMDGGEYIVLDKKDTVAQTVPRKQCL